MFSASIRKDGPQAYLKRHV